MIIADTCLVFHLFNETFLTTNAQEVLSKDPLITLAIDFGTLLVTEDKEILKNCSKLALNLCDFLRKI